MPVALLAFANDWSDDKRRLRCLLDEGKAIDRALAPIAQHGFDVLPPIHNATVDDVIAAFRAHHDQIRIFHFGGHADGSTLLFEDAAGNPAEAHASGLASYLGEQTGLVLVFLNGCSTQAHTRRLRDAGVKAVVATTHAIQDTVSAEFAKIFYAELAVHPLRTAFDTAMHVIRMRRGDDPRAIMRDVDVQEAPQAPAWPWILDCEPGYDAWTPRAEIARRRWWRRLRIATAAVSLLLTMSLALSADARHTTCRMPVLRSVCAAIGVGDVPTAEEEALWRNAVLQDSGDGLRGYLKAYPTGVHVPEALTLLAACTRVHVEARGPERVRRYPVRVNKDPTRELATEQEARNDAVARGAEEAVESCRPLEYGFDILSASFDPQRWTCKEDDSQYACGLQGEAVCRVRARTTVEQERCRGDAYAMR